MKIRALLCAVTLALCGCTSTREVYVEIRMPHGPDKITRVNFVGETGVGAGPARLATSDETFDYFTYQNLIRGYGSGHIVVDLDDINRSEVYRIRWHSLGWSTNWSTWRDPDEIRKREGANGRGADLQILYGQESSGTNELRPATQIRYRTERFTY